MSEHDLFATLVQAEITLYGAVESRLRATTPLALTQYEILRLIDARTGCRVGDISRELLITVGAASKAVDRLEAEGWVRRRPNPANRRSSLLELTQTGQALLSDATHTVDRELAAGLRGFDESERNLLLELLERVRDQPAD